MPDSTLSLPTRAVLETDRVRSLVDLVLSQDPKQRRCIFVQLLSSLMMGLSVAAMAVAARYGLADPRQVGVLGALCALASLTFFTVLRSGRNQRYRDPTLALPQTIVAQSLIAIGYAIGGPFHAVGLLMLSLVMVFGMFSMRANAARIACLYTVVLLALVMAWRVKTDPRHFSAHIELIYFMFLATTLPAISGLSGQLMTMRQRLKKQKVALEEALERIRDMATRDELTSLPNRRCMMTQMQEHALRRARGGLPFYIGMIDLDHFKAINDTHGHAVGDDVLRAFGAQAKAALRTTDLIGRWGGEEFLLVLPETRAGAPAHAVARLRAQLRAAAVSNAAPHLRIGFSCGLTSYVEGEPIDQAIDRADRALYQAKSNGRARTVVL